MREHVPNESIDLVFTDPPYGIDGAHLDDHYLRDETFVVPGYVDVPLDDYAAFSVDWIREVERCLRPGGSAYIVSGYTGLRHILNALAGTSLTEINHLIAQYTFAVATTKKWVSAHYHILYWSKPGKPRTFNTNCRFAETKDSYHDRLSVQQLEREYKPRQQKNKNQLPESFVTKYILYSSNRGDMVMDPFCGGFTTGRVALRYGRNFIGFEINTHAYDAFSTTLNDVDVLPDPEPIQATTEEITKREKLRAQWRKKRQERKAEKAALDI